MNIIRRNANVPNSITLLRALVLPFGLSAFCKERFGWALVFFIVLAMTDLLDGYAARRLKQVTPFGKVFDSALDKALTVSFLFVILIEPGPVEFRWIPLQESFFVLYVLAEAGLAVSRIDRFKEPLGFMAEDGATKVSKIKMWSLCIAVCFMLLGLATSAAWPLLIGEVLFCLAVLLTGFAFAARFSCVSQALRSYRKSLTNRFAIMCWDRLC